MAKQHFKRRDEIEAELAELKSRKCENCNIGEPDDCFTTIYCNKGVKEFREGSNSLGFGCNKWESK